ncbi:MAG: hypothetical protein ACI85O_003281 [Saprospiraceae bacterium]|jgi:hypothetical protein
MELFLEIVKLTIPALIVFITVYFLMKQHSETELAMRYAELQKTKMDKISAITVPLKLTAYERLALFCERISLNNLLIRLPIQDQSAASLRVGLMLAIQQEYEHNMTQQVYVSENLWQIIKLCKDDNLVVINGLYEKLTKGATAKDFVNIISNYLEQVDGLTPLQKAQLAIRKEAGVLLN